MLQQKQKITYNNQKQKHLILITFLHFSITYTYILKHYSTISINYNLAKRKHIHKKHNFATVKRTVN